MFTFEWDDPKAAGNLKKHQVSFDEAVTVFGDLQAVTFADTEHSAVEDRSRTYGISSGGRLLVVVHTERKNMCESSARARQPNMKKTSMSKTKNDIPELTREQLGKGVRGKYFQQYTQHSNVVVLKPEIQKAFPTSEAVNKALANMLAFSQETQALVVSKSGRTVKRRAA